MALLLANGAEIDKLGPEEETPLSLAASGGHHDVIRLLIEKGANVNHQDHVMLLSYLGFYYFFSI